MKVVWTLNIHINSFGSPNWDSHKKWEVVLVFYVCHAPVRMLKFKAQEWDTRRSFVVPRRRDAIAKAARMVDEWQQRGFKLGNTPSKAPRYADPPTISMFAVSDTADSAHELMEFVHSDLCRHARLHFAMPDDAVERIMRTPCEVRP